MERQRQEGERNRGKESIGLYTHCGTDVPRDFFLFFLEMKKERDRGRDMEIAIALAIAVTNPCCSFLAPDLCDFLSNPYSFSNSSSGFLR